MIAAHPSRSHIPAARSAALLGTRHSVAFSAVRRQSPDPGRAPDLPAARGAQSQDPSPQPSRPMVRIRLRRTGRKKAPTFRIVAADSKSPRDGKFIEIVGPYMPRQTENAIGLKTDRVHYWLDSGAQPSDTVRSLLRRAGLLKARHESRLAAKLQRAAVPVAEQGGDQPAAE